MNPIQKVYAAGASLVTCSGGDCGVCSVLATIVNAYNYLLAVSFVVAVLILAIAGFTRIFSLGKQRYLDKSKRILRGAIWGFTFILIGWLAIRFAVSAVGYQNTGGWWQFECTEDGSSTASDTEESDYLSTLNAYPELSGFIKSGETSGIIKGPLSEDRFLKQLEMLKNGEKIIFSLPVKQVYGGKEYTAQMPFLAGYKSGDGTFVLDPASLSNFGSVISQLLGNTGGGNISFLNKTGGTISANQGKELVPSLIATIAKALLNSLGGAGGSSGLANILSGLVSGDLSQLLSNPANLNKTINTLGEALKISLAQNPGSGLMGQAMAALAENTFEYSDMVASVVDSGKTSGDRTETGSKDEKSAASDSSKDLSQPRKPEDWKREIKPGEKPDPGTHDDNFSKLPEGEKDKDAGKDLCADDWNEGDGSKMAVLKALRRIARRDKLRYEMMFRKTNHVGIKEGGGECKGCGDIYVPRKDKIVNIDHILVHEGTHAGDFCLGSLFRKMANMGDVEAVACANQMGSVDTTKGHKDMKEFDEGPVKNTPEVTYNSGSGKSNGQVRGHLARYWVENQPKGDMSKDHLSALFEFMTKYPISKG